MDTHTNFAFSTVLTAPSPASSGTTLVVASGDGALFPQPSTAGPFNIVVCPVSTQPTSANAEIMRCTARSTDTLTVTRTQESTSARTVVVGDQVFLAVTKATLTDIEDDLIGVQRPRDFGWLTWNAPVGLASLTTGNPLGGLGVLNYWRLPVPRTMSVTNILVAIAAGGTGLTSGQCLAGLYDSTGAKLGATADQSAVWNSLGVKTMAITGGPITVPGSKDGFCWVAYLINGSGVAGHHIAIQQGGALMGNFGTTASNAMSATGATVQTALPPSFTPSALTQQPRAMWCALS